MNPLVIILALSLLANAILGHAYLSQRDTATVAKVETKQATGAAVACDKGVESLQIKAAENKAAAAPARAKAASEAQAHNARADTILAAPPAVPGDACKSAEAVVDDWWQGMGKP